MTIAQLTKSAASAIVGQQFGSTRFALATESDDDELRDLLCATPMAGSVRLLFLREPSYLEAARIQGDEVQVIVARTGGMIAGVATRALRPTWINGEPVTAGYLSDLRIASSFRGGMLLQRGYRFLRELHGDGRAQVYSTVIVADNRAALAAIATGRAGLPSYVDLGLVHTPMLHLRRPLPTIDADIRRGSVEELAGIVAQLNTNRLQFAPRYRTADFLPGGHFQRLRAENFYVLRRDGQVRGVLAVWDQTAFRQTVVHSYGGALRWLRPVVNLVHSPPLPACGRALTYAHVALISTDDEAGFRALLRRACNDAVAAGAARLVVGLHERDPRRAALADYRSTPFAGRLFAVAFDGAPDLDGRVPYVEASLL